MGQLAHHLSLWTAALLWASAAAEGTIPLVKRDHPAVVSAKLHAAPARPIPALQARDTISALAMKDMVCSSTVFKYSLSDQTGRLQP
jgi:hypothetical protein